MSTATPQFDAEELEQLRALIDEANADEDGGRTVPHEAVREWLLALARGERPPPPSR